MEITTLRVLATVASFIVFVAIAVWAWRNRNSSGFKEAESLPFTED
jgi:cytochrome c oxidase cbb3-type subunit IV